MRKLKLNLDQLTVDSFGTTPADEKKGTVLGEQCTCQTACTCPGCNTCDAACGTGWTNCGSCDSGCGACDSNDPSLTVGGPNCLCCW
ncbi:MAG TPA: hypothetical protein VGC13_23845 [Longimicrobium sp.]|jgi:hypothetical protein|uniref:hypothetical protein n=1 Tax=Longimicrobium sp. TaxID=2029185 RepID=UPI002ED8C8E3